MYVVFEGKVLRTPFRALASQACEAHGPTHKRCLFASSCHLRAMPATPELRVVVEVSDAMRWIVCV